MHWQTRSRGMFAGLHAAVIQSHALTRGLPQMDNRISRLPYLNEARVASRYSIGWKVDDAESVANSHARELPGCALGLRIHVYGNLSHA